MFKKKEYICLLTGEVIVARTRRSAHRYFEFLYSVSLYFVSLYFVSLYFMSGVRRNVVPVPF